MSGLVGHQHKARFGNGSRITRMAGKLIVIGTRVLTQRLFVSGGISTCWTKPAKAFFKLPFGMVNRDMDAGCLLTKGFTLVDAEFELAFTDFYMKRALTLLETEKQIWAAGSV